ncbi:hypothetical protein FOL47_005092, partial [Perkinsus chesapeaki]
FAWSPRDTLPAIADAIARSIAPTVCAVRVNAATTLPDTATLDIEIKPDYLPGQDIRTFSTPDDDFDALYWLAKAQAECTHLQRLHEVNPSKYQLNDAGLLHVNGRYMVPKAARLHRPPSGTLKRRREVMELIYVDIVGPLPI